MLRSLFTGLVVCSLVACGSNPPAPVEDRNRSSSPDARVYRVQRGDTLYSIAFRYGLDFRRVAAANRIPAPYTIYPGQTIRLKEATPPPASSAARPKTASPSTAPRQGTTTTTSAPKTGAKTAPKPAPKPAPVARPTSTAKPEPASASYTGGAVTAWRWPTSGRVTRGFSASVHKGIDIAGKRGDPVLAAADGKVVYAGSGIVGLGELLIVKHNEVYLSAYAHNDRLLVAEGQIVRAGQKIAEKGNSGTDTVKLHFEIRREGKPVDPQRLLPRR